MRERVFTHVSTRLRKAAFPLPLVLLFLKTARFEKTTRGVFPKSPLVFDDTPQVSKFASFSSNLFGTLWLKILIFVIRNTLHFLSPRLGYRSGAAIRS